MTARMRAGTSWNNERETMKTAFWIILIGVLSFMSWDLRRHPLPAAAAPAIAEQPTPAPTMPPQVKKDVAWAMRNGAARTDRNHEHRIYVDPIFWWQLNAEQKENWVNVFAVYCSFPGDRAVEVYDNHSGKKLASTGPWEMYRVKFYDR